MPPPPAPRLAAAPAVQRRQLADRGRSLAAGTAVFPGASLPPAPLAVVAASSETAGLASESTDTAAAAAATASVLPPLWYLRAALFASAVAAVAMQWKGGLTVVEAALPACDVLALLAVAAAGDGPLATTNAVPTLAWAHALQPLLASPLLLALALCGLDALLIARVLRPLRQAVSADFAARTLPRSLLREAQAAGAADGRLDGGRALVPRDGEVVVAEAPGEDAVGVAPIASAARDGAPRRRRRSTSGSPGGSISSGSSSGGSGQQGSEGRGTPVRAARNASAPNGRGRHRRSSSDSSKDDDDDDGGGGADEVRHPRGRAGFHPPLG